MAIVFLNNVRGQSPCHPITWGYFSTLMKLKLTHEPSRPTINHKGQHLSHKGLYQAIQAAASRLKLVISFWTHQFNFKHLYWLITLQRPPTTTVYNWLLISSYKADHHPLLKSLFATLRVMIAISDGWRLISLPSEYHLSFEAPQTFFIQDRLWLRVSWRPHINKKERYKKYFLMSFQRLFVCRCAQIHFLMYLNIWH